MCSLDLCRTIIPKPVHWILKLSLPLLVFNLPSFGAGQGQSLDIIAASFKFLNKLFVTCHMSLKSCIQYPQTPQTCQMSIQNTPKSKAFWGVTQLCHTLFIQHVTSHNSDKL